MDCCYSDREECAPYSVTPLLVSTNCTPIYCNPAPVCCPRLPPCQQPMMYCCEPKPPGLMCCQKKVVYCCETKPPAAVYCCDKSPKPPNPMQCCNKPSHEKPHQEFQSSPHKNCDRQDRSHHDHHDRHDNHSHQPPPCKPKPPPCCQPCCAPPVKTKYIIPCYRYEDGRIQNQPTVLMRRACELACGVSKRPKPKPEKPSQEKCPPKDEKKKQGCCYPPMKKNTECCIPVQVVNPCIPTGECVSSPECRFVDCVAVESKSPSCCYYCR